MPRAFPVRKRFRSLCHGLAPYSPFSIPLMSRPPPGNRRREILPRLGRQIRHGDPDAVPIRSRVVKPLGRREIEAKTAGVANGEAFAAQGGAHVVARLSRGRLVEGAPAAKRDIEAVGEMQLGRERSEL